MRRSAKLSSSRIPLRKPVSSASLAARRSFPAWIDAGEATAPFAATRLPVPRVRAGLVLRALAKPTPGNGKVPHARAR